MVSIVWCLSGSLLRFAMRAAAARGRPSSALKSSSMPKLVNRRRNRHVGGMRVVHMPW